MLHMFMISKKVLLSLKDFSIVNCEKRHVAKDIVMLFPSLLSCLSREHWNFSCFFGDDILRISRKFPIIPHFSRKKNSRGDIFNTCLYSYTSLKLLTRQCHCTIYDTHKLISKRMKKARFETKKLIAYYINDYSIFLRWFPKYRQLNSIDISYVCPCI